MYGREILIQILFAIFFFAAVLFLMRFDRKHWGTLITPGVVLCVGYAVIVLIYAVALCFLDMPNINSITYAALGIFVILCIFISLLSKIILRWHSNEIFREVKDSRVVPLVFLLVAIVVYSPFALTISLSNASFWSADVRDDMGRGFVGHMHIVLAFATVWYASSNQRSSWLRTILIVIAIFMLSLYPVKGWTLIPLTAVIYASVFRGGRPSIIWGALVKLCISGVILFFTIYLVRAENVDMTFESLVDLVDAIFLHLLHYLLAGFFGLNAVLDGLELRGGLTILFAPIFNIYASITGENFVSHVSNIYVDSMFANETSGSNVYSYLGSLIGYGGLIFGTLFAVFFIFTAYLTLGIAWRFRAAPLRAASLYNTAILTFGWFDYYYWLLTPYEILFFSIFAAFILIISKE